MRELDNQAIGAQLRIHGLVEPPTPRELGAPGEIYRPYRTVAAWYCWRAVDTVLPEG